jgi:DedD protein
LQEREEIVPKTAGAPAAPAPAPRAEANRAQNLLEGKSGAAASSLRVVVQVGAFADPAKAREARQKLEKAGIKSYTQVVDTKEGQRTRVRAGPFSTREEAEQVAAKIRSLDLPASIRTL